MAGSDLGVPQILPRTNAGWQKSHGSPSETTSDVERHRHGRRKNKTHTKPPEPGTGRIVDKIA